MTDFICGIFGIFMVGIGVISINTFGLFNPITFTILGGSLIGIIAGSLKE